MSRTTLHIQAGIFRFFQVIGSYCDRYLSTPLPPPPSFTRRINSAVGSTPGSFDLLFYAPPSYQKPKTKSDSDSNSNQHSETKHPLLIDFHGGGYTIGRACDDARWFAAVLEHNPDCLIVSVDYRLAPSYPFPVGIEDCVSAVLYLWENAEEFGIDVDKTSFSGFSSGGNFTFTVAMKLCELLKERRDIVRKGTLRSLISFYPALDWTISKEQRKASNVNSKPLPVPPGMGGLYEGSYLHPRPDDLRNPLLSPGLASGEILRETLPHHLVIITCWADPLLAEAETFRERLKVAGKRVEGYTVPGVEHGWDKWPSWRRRNQKRDEAYEVAALSLGESWA
ncbi:hypothetical protein HYALB_00000868 [Hymenoscyphus albidus]|uniref:Alpha/beta hydrolase fold-3 domain-containing protein n=1 Tax=Hymenoscyphus albidus TaxID=595503 RepID=A0A9N9Q0Q2_9HELO|nr:hypothetical protein HYALB_00000868 [Hymenoscyphus albidus]